MRTAAETYRIVGLVQRYGQTEALSLPDLAVARSSILGLFGPNGSGKSTLLRLLALIEKPTEGRVCFFGRETGPESVEDRRRVTLLLQDPYLLRKTVFDNVAFGLKIRRQTDGLEKRVGEALEWVGLSLNRFGRRSWRELSGGEAQRVAMAARLAVRPEVLLLDEPTANVDAASAVLIQEAALRARRSWGATLVVASHDLTWLEEISDEVIHLFGGRMSEAGRLNLIPGPWASSANGKMAVTTLGEDQPVFAPPPPDQKTTAVVSPSAISLFDLKPNQTETHNLLFGRIVELKADRSRISPAGGVTVGILVAGMKFFACLSQPEYQQLSALPGQEIWLSFPISAMDWL